MATTASAQEEVAQVSPSWLGTARSACAAVARLGLLEPEVAGRPAWAQRVPRTTFY